MNPIPFPDPHRHPSFPHRPVPGKAVVEPTLTALERLWILEHAKELSAVARRRGWIKEKKP